VDGDNANTRRVVAAVSGTKTNTPASLGNCQLES
jgi:hypothetical protein